MRHWFLVLMIALLPLRGWVGDAMAVEMFNSPTHAMVVTAAAESGHPCPDHAASAAAHHGTTDGSGDHKHTACDVCNGPALAIAALALQALPPAHSMVVRPAELFASSETRRGVKPPIS